MSLFDSLASRASFLTRMDATENALQRTTTALACASAVALSISSAEPGTTLRSHQTDQPSPWNTRASAVALSASSPA